VRLGQVCDTEEKSRKNKIVWEVVHKCNVTDNDTHVVLDGVKRGIETAIKKVRKRVSTLETT